VLGRREGAGPEGGGGAGRGWKGGGGERMVGVRGILRVLVGRLEQLLGDREGHVADARRDERDGRLCGVIDPVVAWAREPEDAEALEVERVDLEGRTARSSD